MADQSTAASSSFTGSGRVRGIAGGLLVLAVAAGLWFWTTRNRESTDDAQVEAHVSTIASRVGGVIAKVAVDDNAKRTITLRREIGLSR